MSADQKPTITVGVYGGLVQWIQDIPQDIRVVVHDYDVDGCDEGDLYRDSEGDLYAEAVWEREED